jgi:hypothetical protein
MTHVNVVNGAITLVREKIIKLSVIMRFVVEQNDDDTSGKRGHCNLIESRLSTPYQRCQVFPHLCPIQITFFQKGAKLFAFVNT